MAVFKVDPQHSASRPGYVLLHEVLEQYVRKERKPVNNGFRSLDHQTNMQDFVLQFGFRPVYTDLRIVYRPTVDFAVRSLYPFRALLAHMPALRPVSSLTTLLKQEEIRRSF
jgi:hypothetical protein